MRALIVEADGGSRGNPGVAGYGALVREVDGTVLRELAAPLGTASNNVAEYTGLIQGLSAAAEIAGGAPVEVLVRMDSKLVVEQMSGRWKIKHPDMARLAREAGAITADLEASGGSVTYTWIPRGQNAAADALSNEGMDGIHVDRRPARTVADEAVTGVDGDAAAPDGDGADEGEIAQTAQAQTELVSAPQPLPRRRPAPDLGEATRLVLVRHGVTDFTTSGRLDGRGGADPGLSAEGLRQARAAGAGLIAFLGEAASSARLITSDLARARQTGSAIGSVLGSRAVADPDWDEIAFGDWDGHRVAELVAAHPQALTRLRAEEDFRCPGGETHGELRARVRDAFDRASEPGGTVVVVTHRAPIGAALAHVLGMPLKAMWRLAVAPASFTSIRMWRDGESVVEFVNDTSHLR